jgi:hypothetical protein
MWGRPSEDKSHRRRGPSPSRRRRVLPSHRRAGEDLRHLTRPDARHRQLAGGGRKGSGGGGSKGGRPICGDADWLWRAEKDRGGVGAREAQRIRHETLGALSVRFKCVSSAWKRRRSHFVGEETLPSSHLLI